MEWEELSRRKVLAGIASAGGAGAIVGQGTAALFSDEETLGNDAMEASSIVAGVVDINVEISRLGDKGVVCEISLPEDSDNQDINNNPSHVWVRSTACPSPESASNLQAQLVLECDGDNTVLDGNNGGTRLGDIIANLSDGTLLNCAGGPSDAQDCLEPGETRRLKIKLLEDPSNELSSDRTITFGLKFFAQQCRHNTEPDRMDPPFTETGPDSCSPPPTPGRPFCLFPCPADSLTDLSTPLAFDNSKLPSETELFGDRGLSFIALCGPDGIDSGDVTLHVTARNEDGEPTRVYWEVDSGTSVEQVTWKFGTTIRKKVFPDGATSGTVVTDPNAGQPGPSSPSNFCSRSGTSGIKYDSIDRKSAGDQLPRLTQQLNEIDGINLTSEILDRSALGDISPVPEGDTLGGFTENGTAIVGSTNGENVIDAGGSLTVTNNGAVVGTVTNTFGNDVVIENDGAVAGDIGIEVTDENGKTLKGTGNVKIKSGSTVVGDVVTNVDGKNVKVVHGEKGNRSELLGDARTSGGGNVEVKDYGRVSGTVETDSGGNVKVKSNSRVEGDALTSGGGKIQVGNSGPGQVRGTADSTGGGDGGDIVVDGSQGGRDPSEGTPRRPAKVFGGVRAGGQANLQDANVKNGVEAKGDCDIDNSVVCGDVVSDGGNVDIDNFSIIQDGDVRGNSVTDEELAPGEEEGAGDAEAAQTIGGVQNSFVGGDVVAESGDIDIPSSVICGDVVAKEGAVDIDSGKTGPPKPLGGEAEPKDAPTALDLPREEARRRSLIGGVVRVDAEDCDIAGATVFADGTTETDTIDDNLGVLVTQQASGGNDLTITDDDKGELQSIIKGDVVVNGQLNVDIDNGSRVEGKVRANAGTVSLSDVTVTGPDANAVDDDAVVIGDGGKIDQLDGNATIEGNVRIKSGGVLNAGGPATIKGDVCVEPGGTANLGNVTVEGVVKRNCQSDGGSGSGSPTNPSSPSISCPLAAPSPNFPTLDISPSVSSPSFTVSPSDCRDLAFDNTNLPDEDTLNLSKGPANVRSQLNSTSGIELTERVLSNNLASQQIKKMPNSPSELKLGGNSPAARVGATKKVVPGTVTLKNDSTVVGTIETNGTFKLKGSSAVAGDVEAATVETIKNSLLVGDLTTTTAGNALSIESGSLVCGTVDAAGKIQIKQARVNGTVTAAGSIEEINESTVTGDVTTTQHGNISIKSESLIDGKVDADGAIPEVKGSEVTGPLEAGGNIGGVKQSEIGGNVRTRNGSDGTVTVEESTVGGSIDADGNVSAVKSNSAIEGDVTAGGDIPELKNSVVTGKVETKPDSDGTITIEGAEIGGPVTADGKISAIKSKSAIGGDVTANGDISAIKGSQVDGDVRTTDGSDGTVKVKNSDIGGLVDADGNVEAIKSKSAIEGDVTAGGTISELKNSDIGGKVTTTDGGDVAVETSTIVGPMDVDGTISKIKASDVGENVEAANIAALKGAQINGDVTVTDGRKSIAITRNNRESVICGDVVATDGRVEKVKNSTVTGSVRAAQVGKLKGKKTEVGGDVETTDPDAGLTIKGGSTVHGTVDAAGPIPEINSSTVEGTVRAGGKLKVKSSTVDGSIDADGRVEKIKSSDVGAVTADGNVTIKGSNTGKVVTTSDSGGDLVLEGSSTVDGDITLDGRVTKIKGSRVEGNVRASEVRKIKDSTVDGSIDADGDVLLKGNTKVRGDVISTGTVTKTSGVTVDGTIKENQ